MKAYFLKEAGPVENLQLQETPIPELKAGEVLVKVKAISINPVDYKARGNDGVLSWIYQDVRPIILGWDISGVVEKVDEGTNFQVGDEVFGMVNFIGFGNAYAEYVAAPASHLALKPANISFEEAAGATLAALTALQGINTAGVKAGAKALVHGASGGVGHYAAQLLVNLGADVYGTSSSNSKDFVESLGVKHIDYSAQRFEDVATDFDFVFNTVPGETFIRSIDAAKPGGSILSIINPSEEIQAKAAAKDVNLEYILVASNGEDMKTLADLMAAGKVKTNVEEVFSFENLPQAHTRAAAGNGKGKIIVTLS